MELKGCSGCSGFSYTQKYKQSIVDFCDWIHNNEKLGVVKYKEVQRLIEESGGCKNSETRMIVPFMLKVGIINKESCEWHGSKLHAIHTKNLFTKSGESFIQFLKIELERDDVGSKEALNIIQEIFEKFAKIQFYFLYKSDEKIYEEMVRFLLKNQTMDETEFFMLCTAMQDNQMNELSARIESYRNGEYDNQEIKITYNINAYSYTSRLLVQYNLFEQRGKSIMFNAKFHSYFKGLIEDKWELEE